MTGDRISKMSFPPVPSFSKKKINKYGEQLVSSDGKDQISLDAVNLWRACHAYPINTFNATLRKKVKPYKGLVAQRLKRLPTIKDKLKRFPTMKLSRMQDIGGLRAVVKTVTQLKKLYKQYKTGGMFTHELVDTDDYLNSPKADGYRGIHLIFRYKHKSSKNSIASSYNGLLVELQFRTKLQHTWATAVETVGISLQYGFKFGKGDKSWLDFFALTSSAFAHMEGTPLVPGYEKLSKEETFKAVARNERKHKFLKSLKAFGAAVSVLPTERTRKNFYHLIILRPEDRTVEIRSYGQTDTAQAATDYAKFEARADAGEKLEPVLVSAGPIEFLKKAYPNYFLDIQIFIKEIEKIISQV